MPLDRLAPTPLAVLERARAIRRAGATEPVLHPEGFVQLKLDPEGNEKLHVWHPVRLRRLAAPRTFHDHVWDLDSYVLVGQLLNQVYDWAVNPRGEHRLWCVFGLDRFGLGGTDIVDVGVNVHLRVDGSETVSAGSWYHLGHRKLHRSKAYMPTATYMTKSGRLSDQNPVIVCYRGETPDSSLELTVEQAEAQRTNSELMWDVIESVLSAQVTTLNDSTFYEIDGQTYGPIATLPEDSAELPVTRVHSYSRDHELAAAGEHSMPPFTSPFTPPRPSSAIDDYLRMYSAGDEVIRELGDNMRDVELGGEADEGTAGRG